MVEDLVIWPATANGSYTVSSGYQWLCNKSQLLGSVTDNWSWIWKLSIPENMKHFIWLACHGNFPTKLLRVQRYMALNASCHFCGAATESILHVLKECPQAARVRVDLIFIIKLSFFFQIARSG